MTSFVSHKRLMELMKKSDKDYQPYGKRERESGDCSMGCRHAVKLEGELGNDWVVCTNPRSHRSGLLTFEHQGCLEFESEERIGQGVYRYMVRSDASPRGQHAATAWERSESTPGEFVLNSRKFGSEDEAWSRAKGVSHSREPFVFEEADVRDCALVCRGSRGTLEHLAEPDDCRCCTAVALLDEERGGITVDQLVILEQFGLVTRSQVVVNEEGQAETVFKVTDGGRQLLENLLKR